MVGKLLLALGRERNKPELLKIIYGFYILILYNVKFIYARDEILKLLKVAIHKM